MLTALVAHLEFAAGCRLVAAIAPAPACWPFALQLLRFSERFLKTDRIVYVMLLLKQKCELWVA